MICKSDESISNQVLESNYVLISNSYTTETKKEHRVYSNQN